MKDRFSSVAAGYARFRPHYPQELFDLVLNQVQGYYAAWDAGTGNGQVAAELAKFFTQVYASDISSDQLQHATHKPNISYAQHPAEATPYPNDFFDLVTVAQAVHWFRFQDFYSEVMRTLKKDGVLAVWGYGLIQTEGKINELILDFYHNLDEYWDDERRHVDEAYANIEFPLPAIPVPYFFTRVKWNCSQLSGYLSTWSAVRQYIKVNQNDPVENLRREIAKHWNNDDELAFEFPIFLKLGKK